MQLESNCNKIKYPPKKAGAMLEDYESEKEIGKLDNLSNQERQPIDRLFLQSDIPQSQALMNNRSQYNSFQQNSVRHKN